jgi:hypothetical protein
MLFLSNFILSSINAIYFEDGELCMVKRNFTVATCGLKPEITDVQNVLKKMENEISTLKSELSEVKSLCSSCLHREGIES